MQKFEIIGGNPLKGTVKVSGSKNVALKLLVAACLTDEPVVIHNVPLIDDVYVMVDILKDLGVSVTLTDHTLHIHAKQFGSHIISLEKAAKARTSVMFMVPLLYRMKEAIIPNPGGCRLGARPINRIVEGLQQMNAEIEYRSEDGFFHAKTDDLKASHYTFQKNTHTGTETLIMAASIAGGKTILKNAAEEPEIDDLIDFLNAMGAQITRSAKREITIFGKERLHGTEFTISPDRNEVVTFAIAAIVTKGNVTVENVHKNSLKEFLEMLSKANGGFEETKNGMRFYYKDLLVATDVVTSIYPGFMTDWQSPWAVLMTQAEGVSTIHETVFENKCGYYLELKKMGAKITPFKPHVEDPESFYNFNLDDDQKGFVHALKIYGPTELHNAVVNSIDIRAGATVVVAALAAKGKSTIFGIEKLDRGYENFEIRLNALGANIQRVKED